MEVSLQYCPSDGYKDLTKMYDLIFLSENETYNAHTSSSTLSRSTENGTDSNWSKFPVPLLKSFFFNPWKESKKLFFLFKRRRIYRNMACVQLYIKFQSWSLSSSKPFQVHVSTMFQQKNLMTAYIICSLPYNCSWM